jgi:ribosome assembly protein YihI (activator of Der GTPase)
MDYDKFLWLCEELQMKYVPIPQYHRRLSKMATLKKVARDEALRIMKEKMEAFKLKLVKESEEFRSYKEQELMKIEEEIQELGLSDSDPIKKVHSIMKDGSLIDLDGNIKPLDSRRTIILGHKLKLAEIRAKERESKV